MASDPHAPGEALGDLEEIYKAGHCTMGQAQHAPSRSRTAAVFTGAAGAKSMKGSLEAPEHWASFSALLREEKIRQLYFRHHVADASHLFIFIHQIHCSEAA